MTWTHLDDHLEGEHTGEDVVKVPENLQGGNQRKPFLMETFYFIQ